MIKDLTPQVVNAARVLFTNPGNPAAVEHFDLLKRQWEENMERLRMLTDEAVDSAALIRAEEEGILRDTERIENAISQRDAEGVYSGAANIAHRAGRVMQVAEMEAQNSEEPNFVDRVSQASDMLSATITPQVQCARLLANNPADAANATAWRKNNQALIDAVGDVRNAVSLDSNDGYYDERFPPPPDMSQLHISASLRPDYMYNQHQRAPLSHQAPPPPPPPPPAAFAPPPPVPPPPMDPYGYYDYD